jgi:hypothetical protein
MLIVNAGKSHIYLFMAIKDRKNSGICTDLLDQLDATIMIY